MTKQTPIHHTIFEQFVPRDLRYSSVGKELEAIILSEAPLLEKVIACKKIAPKDLSTLSFKEVNNFIHAIGTAIAQQEWLIKTYENNADNIADVEDKIFLCDEYIRKLETLKQFLWESWKARVGEKVVVWEKDIKSNLEKVLDRIHIYNSKDPLYDHDYLTTYADQYFADLRSVKNKEFYKEITDKAIVRAMHLIEQENNTTKDINQKSMWEEKQEIKKQHSQKDMSLIRIIPDNIHESLQNLSVDIQKIEKREFFKYTPVTGEQTKFRPYHAIQDVLVLIHSLGIEFNEKNMRLDTHSDTFLICLPSINKAILISNNYGMGTVIFPTAIISTEDLCNLNREILRRNYFGKSFPMAAREKTDKYPIFLEKIKKHLREENTSENSVWEIITTTDINKTSWEQTLEHKLPTIEKQDNNTEEEQESSYNNPENRYDEKSDEWNDIVPQIATNTNIIHLFMQLSPIVQKEFMSHILENNQHKKTLLQICNACLHLSDQKQKTLQEMYNKQVQNIDSLFWEDLRQMQKKTIDNIMVSCMFPLKEILWQDYDVVALLLNNELSLIDILFILSINNYFDIEKHKDLWLQYIIGNIRATVYKRIKEREPKKCDQVYHWNLRPVGNQIFTISSQKPSLDYYDNMVDYYTQYNTNYNYYEQAKYKWDHQES